MSDIIELTVGAERFEQIKGARSPISVTTSSGITYHHMVLVMAVKEGDVVYCTFRMLRAVT